MVRTAQLVENVGGAFEPPDVSTNLLLIVSLPVNEAIYYTPKHTDRDNY